jgi:hypothetical protein
MELDRQISSLDIPEHVKRKVIDAMRKLALIPTLLAWRDNVKEISRVRGIGSKTVALVNKQLAGFEDHKRATQFESRPHMRASSLTLGETCPRSIFLGQEAQHIKLDTSTEYTRVGSLGHRWLEIACLHGEDAAWRYFRKLSTDTLRQIADGLGPALKEFWAWMSVEYPLWADAEIYTEVPVTYPVDPAPDRVAATGTVDLAMISDRHAEIRDWKFYNNLAFAGPMEGDIQMIAYGVAAALMRPDLEMVTVRRMLVYQCRQDELVLNPGSLELARDAVEEVLESVWSRRDKYVVGSHCSARCFQRDRCPVYQSQADNVETKEIAAYSGGLFKQSDDVLRFLMGVKLVQERIEQGMEAAKEWVREHGPIEDGCGAVWGAVTQYWDVITDPNTALGVLMRQTDKHTALSAAQTKKKAIMEACGRFGLAPRDAKDIIELMRDAKAIEKQRVIKWMWKKKKESE